MIRRYPEDRYKRVEIGDKVSATGYKSESYHCNDGFDNPKPDNEQIELIIEASSFKLSVRGRKKILKLKEVVDFALEIDEKKDDKND